MSTLKQVEANRLNAQHSAGPSSVEGRAIASQNALKTGMYSKALIIRGENSEDFEKLSAEYFDHYQPQSPAELHCVSQLIRQTWQLQRYAVVEAQMWEFQVANEQQAGFLDAETPLGQAFLASDQKFARLNRMVAAVERSVLAHLRELDRLRAAREAAAPQPRCLEPELEPELKPVEPPEEPLPVDHSKCGKSCRFKPETPDFAATSPKIGFVSSTAPAPPSTGSPTPNSLPPAPGFQYSVRHNIPILRP